MGCSCFLYQYKYDKDTKETYLMNGIIVVCSLPGRVSKKTLVDYLHWCITLEGCEKMNQQVNFNDYSEEKDEDEI